MAAALVILAMTPATSNITSALPASQQGVASALNDLSREVGGAVGIAVLASILTAAYQSSLRLAHIPAAQAASARSSIAVATRLCPAVAAQAQTAFADGMHLALYVAAGIVLAAAITVGAFLPGRGRARAANRWETGSRPPACAPGSAQPGWPE
jgi:Na+/melibiose symporter-like transporter